MANMRFKQNNKNNNEIIHKGPNGFSLDEVIRQLKKGGVTKIILNGCGLTSSDMRKLAPALEFNRKTLIEMDLKSNKIGDKGLFILSNVLTKCKKLLRVNISKNQIENVGFIPYPKEKPIYPFKQILHGCESLQEIHVKGNKIDAKEMSILAEEIRESKVAVFRSGQNPSQKKIATVKKQRDRAIHNAKLLELKEAGYHLGKEIVEEALQKTILNPDYLSELEVKAFAANLSNSIISKALIAAEEKQKQVPEQVRQLEDERLAREINALLAVDPVVTNEDLNPAASLAMTFAEVEELSPEQAAILTQPTILHLIKEQPIKVPEVLPEAPQNQEQGLARSPSDLGLPEKNLKVSVNSMFNATSPKIMKPPVHDELKTSPKNISDEIGDFEEIAIPPQSPKTDKWQILRSRHLTQKAQAENDASTQSDDEAYDLCQSPRLGKS